MFTPTVISILTLLVVGAGAVSQWRRHGTLPYAGARGWELVLAALTLTSVVVCCLTLGGGIAPALGQELEFWCMGLYIVVHIGLENHRLWREKAARPRENHAQ